MVLEVGSLAFNPAAAWRVVARWSWPAVSPVPEPGAVDVVPYALPADNAVNAALPRARAGSVFQVSWAVMVLTEADLRPTTLRYLPSPNQSASGVLTGDLRTELDSR
jgi:hypothetical protein